jgi:hypothetical protein
MEKPTLDINYDSLKEIESLIETGLDLVKEAVDYLGNKKATTIHPVHVSALLLLRRPAVASS